MADNAQQRNYLLNFGGECPFLGMVEGQKRPLMTSSTPVNAPAYAQMATSPAWPMPYPNLDVSQFSMEANNAFLMQEELENAASEIQNSVEREIALGFDRYTEMRKKRTYLTIPPKRPRFSHLLLHPFLLIIW
jgi:hypothetical protein